MSIDHNEHGSIQRVATPSAHKKSSLPLSHTDTISSWPLIWTPRRASRAIAFAMVGGFILYAVVLSLIVFCSLEILLVVLAPILIDMDWLRVIFIGLRLRDISKGQRKCYSIVRNLRNSTLSISCWSLFYIQRLHR